ncbi:hypothetical protein [Mucilaginibacter pedocola]|uniref:Signal transduction histidine kinase dimerisation/phosphoacceptor domain-containing protein n=1 Tax=Mucilaginibacter pedocola TaxID=1792845 RepID=A0A1S9PI38_9SPHI|nr:hypothetical protein [Mucilaginibacter pedocola]OOQ60616.1 hypothetical protein BC343_23755 [Mucilaginibacter pedocola]
MAGSTGNTPDAEALSTLKHDIKNQLSNITLAIEGLRFELEDTPGDFALYIDSVRQSAKKIDSLLDVIQAEEQE